jgi:hypothetical protein
MHVIRRLAVALALVAAGAIGVAVPHASAAPCSVLSMFQTCMPPIVPQPIVTVGSWCDQGVGILDIQTLNFEGHTVFVAWADQPPMGIAAGRYSFQLPPGPVDVTIGIDGAFRAERHEVPACAPLILSA